MDSFWSLGNAELALARSEVASRFFERGEALARELKMKHLILNALDGQIGAALAHDAHGPAQQLAERLLAEATSAARDASVSAKTDAGTGNRSALPAFRDPMTI